MNHNRTINNRNIERGGILSALVLACLFTISPLAAETQNRISSGYDSFIDRYTVLENDTTESLNEYYLNMTNRFSGGLMGINSNFRNSLKFGNQTVDERFRMSLELSGESSFEVRLETDFYLKNFREGSDYSFSNNYRQLNTSLKIGRKLSDNLRIRSRTRFELTDYDDHTSFDYDYNYMDTGVECDIGSILGNTLRAVASFGVCEAPDTTELSYDRNIFEISTYLGSWGSAGLDMTISADRRDYQGDSRPSSWLIMSYSKMSLKNDGKFNFAFLVDGESYVYDTSDQLYFNSHFIRGGAEFSVTVGERSEISFQPRYARLLCGQMQEERYSEYSIIASYDLMYGSGYWFTFSYEPGYRAYQVEDIYSNFYLNRISLMGSVSFLENYTADLFIMHDPEKHSRRGDDFSITMISASISRGF